MDADIVMSNQFQIFVMDSIEKKRVLKSVLIANGGEIVVRVARILKKLSIRSVGISNEVDRSSEHVNVVDLAIQLKEDKPSQVYLRNDFIIKIDFTRKSRWNISSLWIFIWKCSICHKNGFIFICSTSEQIHLFGLKHFACQLASKANIQLLEHSHLLKNIQET